MYKPKSKDKLHLIDNGTAFDYGNIDKTVVPEYLNHAISKQVVGTGHDAKLHPRAKEWLDSLDADKAKKLLAAHGYNESDPHVVGFVDRLNGIKKLANDYPNADIDRLLHANVGRSGKLFNADGTLKGGVKY